MTDIESICHQRGLRLTKARRETFELLTKLGKPITAYDLLEQLEQRQGRKLAPLTVYRILDFLVEQGFVHKIASTHSYIACDHPEHSHESIHLICTECGSGQELAMSNVKKSLDLAARDHQFMPKRWIVELEGICHRCHVG